MNATLGNRYGFRFIVNQTIPAGAAYAFARSGFIFASAAPPVPQSVPYGATTSFEGLARRWLRDYDSEAFQAQHRELLPGLPLGGGHFRRQGPGGREENHLAGRALMCGIKLQPDGKSDSQRQRQS
ncbi:hypothetical protein ACFY7Z_13390 [Streptomyces sp. NPDC012623]|uniref:hypothetical protein n=1 Tax=unclassified Streptomyces TaxID=2593676 RepID=UPI0036996C9C